MGDKIDQNLYKQGQKIRNFRFRANMSQLELETKIDASPGSISRIENGIINPTKETLSKISNVLNISPIEIADLLGISIFDPANIVSAINTISNSLDLEATLQNAVDIMFGLFPNYNGGVVLLIDEKNKDRLYSKTVSRMPKIGLVYKLLKKPLNKFYIRLDVVESLLAKSVKTRHNFQSYSLVDFAKGSMPDYLPKNVASILDFKSGISMPLLYENEIIGATLYTKSVREEFSEYEQKVLELLNKQIAITIMNAKQHEELLKKLELIKKKY